MALPTLNPKFKALDAPTRYVIVTGGRGGAKSFHVADYARHCSYNKHETILYTRYTMTTAEISVIPEFKEKIEAYNTLSHFKITNRSIINKKSGGKILFRGIHTSQGNQTAALKSIQGVTIWILEEGEEMTSEEEFDKIDNSIRSLKRPNKVIIVMNPCEKEHWIYKRFFINKHPDTTYIHTTYLDNLPNLAQSFVDKAERLKITNHKKYAHIYGGEWGGSDDIIFNNWDTEWKELDSYDWKYNGGDFGFDNDPSTFVEVVKDGRHLYVRELYWLFGASNEKMAEEIIKLGKKNELSIFDSAEKKTIKRLQVLGVYGVPCRKGSDSVFFGIKELQNYIIHIHPESYNLLREFGNYKWKKLRGGQYARNSHGHKIPSESRDDDDQKYDNGIDAIRYVVTYFINW